MKKTIKESKKLKELNKKVREILNTRKKENITLLILTLLITIIFYPLFIFHPITETFGGTMLLINMLLLLISLEVVEITHKRRKEKNEGEGMLFPLVLYLLFVLFQMIISAPTFMGI